MSFLILNSLNFQGGNGEIDSIDLFNIPGDNIESSEMVSILDGGHWFEIELINIEYDEEEKTRLINLIQNQGSYALEEDGDCDWALSDTECWVWGALEIEDKDGNIRVICADEHGNMVNFIEED